MLVGRCADETSAEATTSNVVLPRHPSRENKGEQSIVRIDMSICRLLLISNHLPKLSASSCFAAAGASFLRHTSSTLDERLAQRLRIEIDREYFRILEMQAKHILPRFQVR